MKKRRIITAISIVAVLCIALGGCMLPGVDPIDPVIPVDPAPAPIVASFNYSCAVFPIQTDSAVAFDGTGSSSPDGEIVWGQWDFDDGTVIEGAWVKMVSRWENGVEVWDKVSVRREVIHRYANVDNYDVVLTVWDGAGNIDSTTRAVRVREVP